MILRGNIYFYIISLWRCIVGVDTSSAAFCSFVLIMLNRPDIQTRIQQEIDDTIGPDRFPTFDDRLSMPYTDATILELLRYISHLPISIPHKAIKDSDINGHHIPAETIVTICFVM